MRLTSEEIHNDLQVMMQISDLKRVGKDDEALALEKAKLPLSPASAFVMKKFLGAEWLRREGYDLSRAEARYGKGWLDT
jgi:hypothetical protein